MDPSTKIGLGLLTLLLLPAMVAEWEARRLGDIFYAGIAATGFLFVLATQGGFAAALAIAAGMASLFALSGAVAAAATVGGRRFLTGGHIKLLSSAAVWLGFAGTGLMLLLAALGIVSVVILKRAILGHRSRPALSLIASLSVIAAFIGVGIYR